MGDRVSLIKLSSVSRCYQRNRVRKHVLRDLELEILKDSVVGIQGASGSGKTTLARILAGLDTRFSGVRTLGPHLTPRQVQMVFQDSLQAFNPRLSLGLSLREALVAGGLSHWVRRDTVGARDALERALTEVGLNTHLLHRRPGTLSGGQRQRAAIARALLMKPQVLILDEPVAALDLSIQAKILNVLGKVRDDYGVSLVIISHDQNVLSHMCETVYTLKEGTLWSV